MRLRQSLLMIMLAAYISVPVPQGTCSAWVDRVVCGTGERVSAAAPHPVDGTPAGSTRAGAAEEPDAAVSDPDVTVSSFNLNISLLVAIFEAPQKLLPFADPSYPISKPPQ